MGLITPQEVGGAKANRSGRITENAIKAIFSQKYKVDQQKRFGITNIYGKWIKVDLVVYGLSKYPKGLIIEVKWQSSSGSADEKYPFLAINIKEHYPLPTIVVVDGSGMSDGAVPWLKSQADGEKFVGVFSLEELIAWIIKNRFN